MTLDEFDTFLCDEIFPKIQDTLNIKSGDYAGNDEKLNNFYIQAEMDGVTPFEALRGNWLKHRASIRQGLDELKEGGALRPYEWWLEKCIDSINYHILLLAMIKDCVNEK